MNLFEEVNTKFRSKQTYDVLISTAPQLSPIIRDNDTISLAVRAALRAKAEEAEKK